MNTEFWLFGQYNKATLSFQEVVELTRLNPKTLRNYISCGRFPRPIPGDSFAIQDIAAWIDGSRKAA